MLTRKNVTLLVNAHVDRLTFKGNTATGVEIGSASGARRVLAKREVILCAGGLNSQASLASPDVNLVQIELPYASDVIGKRYAPPNTSWALCAGLVAPWRRIPQRHRWSGLPAVQVHPRLPDGGLRGSGHGGDPGVRAGRLPGDRGGGCHWAIDSCIQR